MLINVFSIAYSCSIRETFSLQNVMIFFKGVFLLTKKKIDYFVIFATKVLYLPHGSMHYKSWSNNLIDVNLMLSCKDRHIYINSN